jgi:oligopeptide transport system ATP-binding protein
MKKLQREFGLTYLFIAHDLSMVQYISDRIAVMHQGKIVELAPKDKLYKNPVHPYTKSLMSAIPQPDPESEKTRQRIIYDPNMHDYENANPKLREISEGHFIYCSEEELAEYIKTY